MLRSTFIQRDKHFDALEAEETFGATRLHCRYLRREAGRGAHLRS